MTREEEIRNAIDTIFPIPPSEKGRKYEQALMATGFEAGVKWADHNPKSPWISVKDDLPCNHDELWVMTGRLIHTKKVLVALIDGTVRLLSMLYDEVNDKWEWESKILKDKIIFWTPIPEPPKE